MRGIPTKFVVCNACGSHRGYPNKKLCRTCLARPRALQWKPEWEQILRDAYSRDRNYLYRRRAELIQLTGLNRSQIDFKAKRLGLRFFQAHPWTAKENQFLQNNCGEMTIKRMAAILGRNADSVRSHLYRIGLRSRIEREGLTGVEFAEVMGVTSPSVYNWINRGYLRTYDGRISEHDAREFITKHNHRYSIRRVDDFLFKALLFGVEHAS